MVIDHGVRGHGRARCLLLLLAVDLALYVHLCEHRLGADNSTIVEIKYGEVDLEREVTEKYYHISNRPRATKN